ncbi:MAG: hypothetical protein JJ901_13305 [Erythrobacter sp.]|uniref:hypothetical protein n=1 Tax=Erythrobacter sp. TaxID=1042 RepID=UPI001B1E2BD2|nr:hypothetical protein [Erythrobacter sp.]MBO6769262.1 hypothetical protein [Erythrobacter sp.]
MRGRSPALIAIAIPVLAGIAYLWMMAAPLAYWAINAAALGLAAALVLTVPALQTAKARRILAVVLIALLFVPLLFGPHVNGIARWLPLGPFALHAGALFLPSIVVLAARDEDFAPPILLAALLAASLQPDAATGLAVMLAAVGLYNARGDWRLVPVAGIAFFASLVAGLRGELPAQPFVERVLVSLAFDQPLGALGLALALLASFFLMAHGIRAEKAVRHSLAGCLFGFSLAAVVSNYPSILIGYGAAPILGFGLAIGLAVAGARRTTGLEEN